ETIPVYIFGTPQSVATSGMVDKDSATAMEKVYIPSAEDARDGTLSGVVSPTLASYLPKGLEYLVNFPYGCAEQTVSSFLPNVALKSLQNFDAFQIVSDEELEKNIVAGLEKLYTYQRGDGGFGYWSSSTRSYPDLSAYIVYALHQTQKAGYGVDQNVIDRANNYLNWALRSGANDEYLTDASRAYILYVMTETGRKDVNLLDNLYEKRETLPLYAKAYLAMAYNNSSDQTQTLMNEILNEVKIDSRGAHFEERNEKYWRYSMNTNTRTTALVLQAMIRLKPNDDLMPKVMRYLLAVREQGHWDTTQSSVTSIFALIDYLNFTEELDGHFTAKLAVDGNEKLSQKFSTQNILDKEEIMLAFEDLNREAYNSVEFNKDGEGTLYYDLSMDYFLTLDELPPTEQGIGITREMTPVQGDGKTIRANDVYKVKLTITAPEDRHFVAVSSPLPAGFEAIDFTYQTSDETLQENLYNDENETEGKGGGYYSYWRNPLRYFNHSEFRDDSVFLFADYLPANVYEYEYLVRATTPGKFKYRPSRVWEMYFPETFGQTEGGWLEIKE
ncbi:MAG: hypothetical protein OEY44_04365, partial [Candidatus Peregrinibacteria bacterium]|nr:hypothetical protein [Candidatus Peregrinibacteria bacterium]